MLSFHPIPFLKFLVKSQPQRSDKTDKKGSYINKRVYVFFEGTGIRLYHFSGIRDHNL